MDYQILIFSDLDGCLLDHVDYTYTEAIPALHMISRRKIPLILCSSKTAAEMAALRTRLGFDHYDAIVENGAGLLRAHESEVDTPHRHAELLRCLETLPADLRRHFKGFSDWTPEQIQEHTGLSKDQAVLAAKRNFSEPGIWSGDARLLDEFMLALDELGIWVQKGGRFTTLSFASNKVIPMSQLIDRYRLEAGKPVCSIAIGDAPNDVAMIEAADYGVILANAHHPPLPSLAGEKTGNITRIDLAGPRGWNQAVQSLLSQNLLKEAE